MLVRELKLVYTGKGRESLCLDSPETVYTFAKTLIGDKPKEVFVSILLNNKNYDLGWDVVSVGTITESLVHPREVFVSAVKKLASSIVVCHNHPSGVTTPSDADLVTTRRLVSAGKIMGIPVIDHVIIGNGYYSMLEHSQMEEQC